VEKKLSEYISLAKNIKFKNNNKNIKVAILSSFTINGLDECLKVKSSFDKINYKSYIGNYNQHFQEIFNEKSDLYEFEPDITFLIIDVRSLFGELFTNPYSFTLKSRHEIFNEKIINLKNSIEIFQKKNTKKLVIFNLQVPSFSPNGIIENKSEFGLHELINKFNNSLVELSKNSTSLFIFDFNQFVSKFGEDNIFNYKQFFLGDIQISFDYIPSLSDYMFAYIKPLLGLNKKCIVLDLDNTLWGGIIGEDGFNGIELGHTSNGRAFIEFQKRLLSYWQQGIILAINSKNNFEDAIKVIKEHPNMILREENFASIQINWNDKALNLKQIADELNISLNSLVFFDDDKINQERIKQEFPEVLTVELSKDPSEYTKLLEELKVFDVLTRTDEDITRGQMYAQQRKRKEFENTISDLSQFLEKLNITVKIEDSNDFLIPRISQLTLKTNQFNLTTRRYQEEQIQKFTLDKNFKIGCAHVKDKFGENGITAVFIIKKKEEIWILDTFLLSCRIMGRGIEDAILAHLLQEAKNTGIKEFIGEFIPTGKNSPSENFLQKNGFVKKENHWVFNLENNIELPKHIDLVK
jgi:FkbH-like protein